MKRVWVGLLTGFAGLSSLTVFRFKSVSKTAITMIFIRYKFLPFLDIHFAKLLTWVQVMILLAKVTLDIFRFLVLLIPFFGSCCKVPFVMLHTGSRFKQRIMFLGVLCSFAVFVISTYLEVHRTHAMFDSLMRNLTNSENGGGGMFSFILSTCTLILPNGLIPILVTWLTF